MKNDYLTKVGDTFGVEDRLREIDDGYRIFYNKLKKRFEVHNVKCLPNTLVLVSPYDELDQRLIKVVRASRVERNVKLIKEIEEHNEKIIKKQEEEIKNKNSYELDKLLKMKSLLDKRR